MKTRQEQRSNKHKSFLSFLVNKIAENFKEDILSEACHGWENYVREKKMWQCF